MLFFENLSLSDSAFYFAHFGKTFIGDPVFISSRALRKRPSHESRFAEYRDTVSSHSFVLRRGNKNVVEFEIPKELKELMNETTASSLGIDPDENEANDELLQEKFLLLYHIEVEATERIDSLLVVPVSKMDPDLIAGKGCLEEVLCELSDEPICGSPLTIDNLFMWPHLLTTKNDNGRAGYIHIEMPEILFAERYASQESSIRLWYDQDSGSLLMLRNSFRDSFDNTSCFRVGPDFHWDGLDPYFNSLDSWRGKHSLLGLPDLPAAWSERIRCKLS